MVPHLWQSTHLIAVIFMHFDSVDRARCSWKYIEEVATTDRISDNVGALSNKLE